MILDEFIGRNCKRTEYIDARGRHWIVRTDPVFVERKLDRYETTRQGKSGPSRKSADSATAVA